MKSHQLRGLKGPRGNMHRRSTCTEVFLRKGPSSLGVLRLQKESGDLSGVEADIQKQHESGDGQSWAEPWAPHLSDPDL